MERSFLALQRRAADPIVRTRLAFNISRLPPGTFMSAELLHDIAERGAVPGAMERIDLFLLRLAGRLAPGQSTAINYIELCAPLACSETVEAMWVVNQARELGYIHGADVSAFLTVAGWQRHAELLRSGHGSNHAFMAMRFGDVQLEQVFSQHLQRAVAETGFELRTVNGPHQAAGSIDDRMRVEIRTSRFLVCDLTHGNRGAYWEAGFAEGLGRPVFYVCRADVLGDPTHPDHPHFDTRQSLIVPWDPADMVPGMLKLKQAIRATLPDLARMED